LEYFAKNAIKLRLHEEDNTWNFEEKQEYLGKQLELHFEKVQINIWKNSAEKLCAWNLVSLFNTYPDDFWKQIEELFKSKQYGIRTDLELHLKGIEMTEEMKNEKIMGMYDMLFQTLEVELTLRVNYIIDDMKKIFYESFLYKEKAVPGVQEVLRSRRVWLSLNDMDVDFLEASKKAIRYLLGYRNLKASQFGISGKDSDIITKEEEDSLVKKFWQFL